MAETITINDEGIPEYTGRKKVVTGSYNFTGLSTSADIATGLERINYFSARSLSAAVSASVPYTDETSFPVDSGTIKLIATTTNDSGIWRAEGE